MKAIPILTTHPIYEVSEGQAVKPYCILTDESQFLSNNTSLNSLELLTQLNIPVMAFGLKNDFQNELFRRFIILITLCSVKSEEIKTICWYCHKKASVNMRVVDVQCMGEQIQIGAMMPIIQFAVITLIILVKNAYKRR